MNKTWLVVIILGLTGGILISGHFADATMGLGSSLNVRHHFVDATTQFLVISDPDVTPQSVVWFSIDAFESGDVQSCGAPLVSSGSFQINCSITSLDAGSTINYIVVNSLIPVGGIMFPTDNVSLALAYGFINAPWIGLGLVGIAAGTYYYRERKTKKT